MKHILLNDLQSIWIYFFFFSTYELFIFIELLKSIALHRNFWKCQRRIVLLMKMVSSSVIWFIFAKFVLIKIIVVFCLKH